MNNQTPILKISELWHLRSWLGRRHGEKNKQKLKAVRLELGHYTIIVGTVKKTNQGSEIRTGPLYYSIVGTVITPVPTVFLSRHYQSINHHKIVPPKEYCRHRCNFRLFSPCRLPSQDRKCQSSEIFRVGVWYLINVHFVARILNIDFEKILTGLLAFFVP